jgi:hypothetical protein
MGLIRGIGARTTIVPGQTHYWWYTIDGGKDLGVSTAAPGFLEPDIGPNMVANNQGVQLIAGEELVTFTQYNVTIANTGGEDVAYNLNVGFFE